MRDGSVVPPFADTEAGDITNAKVTFEENGVGFRISSTQFVLSKSLVEPWKFDPDLASAMRFDGVTLDSAAFDLFVWPANTPIRDGGFRLGRDFKQVLAPPDDNAPFFALRPEGRPRAIALHSTPFGFV